MDAGVYEQAIIVSGELGGYNRVVGLTLNINDTSLKENEKLVNLSFVAYKMIDNAILSNTNVYTNEYIHGNEVQPWEVSIIDTPGVEAYKKSSIIKIRTLINPIISKISGLALYGFMVLNNELNSKGYFIYEDNREETYLKILETGDEELIDKLEKYLNYKDEIERVSQLERQFSEVIENINNTNEINDVINIENDFMSIVIPQLQ